MTESVRLIHIIDDDRAVRDSLRWLLEGEGFVVQTYASGEDFLAATTRERPGCAIVDLRMPGMSGLDLQEALTQRHVRLPLIFVTAHGDVALAVMAMRRGAIDFIEKPFTDERLVESVRRALHVQGQYPGDEEPGIVRARAASLSARERDVLAAVVDGKSSKAIARELCIAVKTVEAHRARIMTKLGTHSLAGLVRLVILHGLLDPARR